MLIPGKILRAGSPQRGPDLSFRSLALPHTDYHKRNLWPPALVLSLQAGDSKAIKGYFFVPKSESCIGISLANLNQTIILLWRRRVH